MKNEEFNLANPNTITREAANGYVEKWQEDNFSFIPSKRNSKKTSEIKVDSFSFKIEDFEEFITRVNYHNMIPGNAKVNGVECRLGIKQNPKSTHIDLIPAMFFEALVGFDGENGIKGTRLGDLELNHSGSDPKVETARYDFSYPCPPTCKS